jgi:hypothetical protein
MIFIRMYIGHQRLLGRYMSGVAVMNAEKRASARVPLRRVTPKVFVFDRCFAPSSLCNEARRLAYVEQVTFLNLIHSSFV